MLGHGYSLTHGEFTSIDAIDHNEFQMKGYLVILLATIAVAAIASAANIGEEEETEALVAGRQGWIAEADNGLGEIRSVRHLCMEKSF